MPAQHREDYFHVIDDLRRRVAELEAAQTSPPQATLPSEPHIGEIVIQTPTALVNAATAMIYDGAGWLEMGGQPGFQMFLNAQVVNHYASSAFTKVPLDAFEQFDGADVSCPGARLAGDNFTVQEDQDGWWIFSGAAFTSTSSATGTLSALSLYRNDAEHKRLFRFPQGAASAIENFGTVFVKVAVGDVFDIRFLHSVGAARNADPGAALTYFHGLRASP